METPVMTPPPPTENPPGTGTESPPPPAKPVLVVPPGAPPLHDILNREICGYIRANPLSDETRGYIRRYLRLILTPEMQQLLGTADDILRWVLVEWCGTQGMIASIPAPALPVFDPFGNIIPVVTPVAPVVTPQALANMIAGQMPPPATPPAVLNLTVEFTRCVSGTFARYDTIAGRIPVPMEVARRGMDAIDEWIQQHYSDFIHDSLEVETAEDLNLNTTETVFDSWGEDCDDFGEKLREIGIDPDGDEGDNEDE